jgi:hypothetical protein
MARPAFRGRRNSAPAQSGQWDEWGDECFMGGVLQTWAEFARFPSMEPAIANI